MKSGIYIIVNKARNLYYVGQSVYVKRRLSIHKRLLAQGGHENSYLQHHYNKYGVEQFEFIVKELCNEQELDEKERFWIAFFKSNSRKRGYNFDSGGNLGKHFSAERVKRMTGKGNPMYGKHHTKEFAEKMRLINRGSSDKLTEENVRNIKERLLKGETQGRLAKEYQVKVATVNKIAKCHNWAWVAEELNVELIKIPSEKNKLRYEKVKTLWEKGFSIAAIARELKLVHKTVSCLLADEIEQTESKIAEIEGRILEAHKKGASKGEIMDRFGIGNKPYSRIVGQCKKEHEAEIKRRCVELRNAGMMVKNIALTLGVHRTTVSKYTEQVNTEVSGDITRHRNA